MNTLVIVAHPTLSTSTINAAWVAALRASGRVTVHLLYEEYADGLIDVVKEQRLLDQHDRIILQFPFQWYSAPALLKSWLDEVLERGWAYGPGGIALQGKELGVAVSTWSTRADYETHGTYGRTLSELTSPFEVTAKRVGMGYLPGFFLTGAGHVTSEGLADNSARYVEHVTAGADG
ncbi:NAD(P)H-dependent oxidoreductase [Cryobacterium luteum]|uniref:Flavodoxin family protein n=1 Tax=Cryobacterium luteum TaxID=1424661 RepID=A0A1H8MF02_9MICO|nr:NAD(P)H-dependent oxidoreductase [Cryobacterium luteum]TFB94429.1 flavodoxin family protein [Cryobacterium luteum]SEO15909.1 NAD(P)H dehydrogenase (quinone) [Cryobacterium luteum]